MHLVLNHLPHLRTERLGLAAPPATLTDLYEEIACLLQSLQSQSPSPAQLQQESLALKHQLITTATLPLTEITPKQARELTLAALASGTYSGALDGTLLYLHQKKYDHPLPESANPKLGLSLKTLQNKLTDILEASLNTWALTDVNDLQLLSGFGKHENRHSLDEGEEKERSTREDRIEFSRFLLASFKAGYAIGVIDSTILYVGKERPGAS